MFSNSSGSSDGRAARGERTRAALVDAAIASFRAEGYEATTIRSIAATVGTSVGTAHYHFASKADLVQELYRSVQEEHRDAAVARLTGVTGLVDRVRIVLETGLDALEPFHEAAPGFLAAAMSPTSTINPLSAASSPARDIAIGVFRDAVAGASTRLPAELRRILPEVSFLGYLLLALFWTYDRSPRTRRTRTLLDGGLGLLSTALPLLRLPASRPLVRRAVRVMEEALPWAE